MEFIRSVFLRKQCPPILLIDEAFAPLDPAAKRLVQDKLKAFCAQSVVLVIYHAESTGGNAVEEGRCLNAFGTASCVQGRGFFDRELRFEQHKEGGGTATEGAATATAVIRGVLPP